MLGHTCMIVWIRYTVSLHRGSNFFLPRSEAFCVAIFTSLTAVPTSSLRDCSVISFASARRFSSSVRFSSCGTARSADRSASEGHGARRPCRSVIYRPAAWGVSRSRGHAGECHGERSTQRDTLLIECHVAPERRKWRLNGGNGGLTVRMVPKRLKWRLLANGAGFAMSFLHFQRRS